MGNSTNSLPDLITKLPIYLQYFIAALIALATLSQLIGFKEPIWGWLLSRLWPHREGWSGDCPRDNPNFDDPEKAWIGAGQRWSQMRGMREGDFFSLNIRKPRFISRIQLDNKGLLCYPLRYRLEYRTNNNQGWEKLGEYSELDIPLKPFIKLLELRFTIIEPRLEPKSEKEGWSPAWSIYDITLTEVRLFGHWWKKPILE